MFQMVHGCPGQFVRKVAIHTRYQNDRITQGVSYFSDAQLQQSPWFNVTQALIQTPTAKTR